MKPLEEVVVFFINSAGKVLLALKSSKAKVAKSKWNGYGGGIEKDETPQKATVRETGEETDYGLIVHEEDLEPMGYVIFINPPGYPNRRVHFFLSRKFFGEPKETEEMMDPRWFSQEDLKVLIFEKKMMPADGLFIPQILAGKKIKNGWVRFKEGYKGIEDSHFEFEDV